MEGKKTAISIVLIIIVPIIICIPIAVLEYKNEILLENLEDLLGDIIGIMATLFGFILTALSILLAFEGNEKTKQLRGSRHYKTILGTYLISAVYTLAGLILFITFYSLKIINNVSSFIYVFITAISFVYMLLSLFYLIITVLTLFYPKPNYH